MNMPKSRDIQAKIPLPQVIWNFGYVTENGVNSNCQIILHRMFMDFLQTYFYRYDIINHIQKNDTGYRGGGIGDGQTNTGSRFDGGQRTWNANG